MVKRDGLTGRHYLEEDERLTPASPSLREGYPGVVFLLRRAGASQGNAQEKGAIK
jgi:hypothetical protein